MRENERGAASGRDLGERGVAQERDVVHGVGARVERGGGDVRVGGAKNSALKLLHGEALASFARFASWSIRTVPRAQNAAADALVNSALEQARDASRL